MNNATPSLRGPLRTLLVAVLALLAGFTLAACTSPTSGSLPDYAPESGATQAAPAAPADGTTDAAGSAERQVTRTAALTVTVPDPTAAAQRVHEVTTGLGGYVTSEQVTTLNAGAQPTATLTVSVPADKLDQVLTDLAGIGGRLAPGTPLAVVHAATEAAAVAASCEARGVRHEVRVWEHGEVPGNLMDAARRARIRCEPSGPPSQNLPGRALPDEAGRSASRRNFP